MRLVFIMETFRRTVREQDREGTGVKAGESSILMEVPLQYPEIC